MSTESSASRSVSQLFFLSAGYFWFWPSRSLIIDVFHIRFLCRCPLARDQYKEGGSGSLVSELLKRRFTQAAPAEMSYYPHSSRSFSSNYHSGVSGTFQQIQRIDHYRSDGSHQVLERSYSQSSTNPIGMPGQSVAYELHTELDESVPIEVEARGFEPGGGGYMWQQVDEGKWERIYQDHSSGSATPRARSRDSFWPNESSHRSGPEHVFEAPKTEQYTTKRGKNTLVTELCPAGMPRRSGAASHAKGGSSRGSHTNAAHTKVKSSGVSYTSAYSGQKYSSKNPAPWFKHTSTAPRTGERRHRDRTPAPSGGYPTDRSRGQDDRGGTWRAANPTPIVEEAPSKTSDGRKKKSDGRYEVDFDVESLASVPRGRWSCR